MKKYPFRLKTNRTDGLVLQIHNTVSSQRHRFILAEFSSLGSMLAAVDCIGNVFIFQLDYNLFWSLPNIGIGSSVSFINSKPNEVLLALDTGQLKFINHELGHVTGSLIGHSMPVTSISFTKDGANCLTSSNDEAIIWDLQSNSQAHRLSLKINLNIKRVLLMPVTNNILALFQDDDMHVWKFGSFEFIKQIVPEVWKSHHINAIAFTPNGRAMVIGGHSPSLVVFCIDSWIVLKVIEFPSYLRGVKDVKFVADMFDGGACKVLALLASNGFVYFVNIEDNTIFDKRLNLDGVVNKISVSDNGKYIASILSSGEVNIYLSDKICASEVEKTNSRNVSPQFEVKKKQPRSILDAKLLNDQIKNVLDMKKLLPMLKELGEYPDKYRILIWKTILQLPCNQESYVSLARKPTHSAFLNMEQKCPLENKSLLKNLKRLLSSLAYWSPLFAEVTFLPEFVFPFVKLFNFDPFVCFEAVVTIIVNWCQHWFQYFPYPPIEILGMIENILEQHDPELLQFYNSKSVTSRVYGWSLLENAFSEVLSRKEWLKLWDHIISNEPAFFIMVVVSFNITLRNTIKSCNEPADFEMVFHNQNPVSMKGIISKAYKLMESTKPEIHPKHYLREFEPLTKGTYTIFNEYPKFIVDYHAERVQEIKDEEKQMWSDQQKIEAQRKILEERIMSEKEAKLEEARLKKLEEAYRITISKEENRLTEQRRKILDLKRNLRHRELEFLQDTKNKLMRKQTLERKKNLERLIEDIARKRAREETELEYTEEEIRNHYMELLAQKAELEMEIRLKNQPLGPTPEHVALERQQERLKNELGKLRDNSRSKHHNERLKMTKQLAVMENELQAVEMELAQEVASRQNHLLSAEDNVKMVELESKTKVLQEQIDAMLSGLSDMRIQNVQKSNAIANKSLWDRQQINDEQEDLVRHYKRGTYFTDEPISWSPRIQSKAPSYRKSSASDTASIVSSRRYYEEDKVLKNTMDLRQRLVEEGKSLCHRSHR